jgi:hypothetical protein
MKNILLTLALLLCFQNILSQTNTVQEFYTKAREAYKAGNHPEFYKMIIEANKLHPYHQGILYYKGIAAALNNHPDEAIGALRQAILVNANFDLELQDLKALHGHTDFDGLKKLKQTLLQPIVTSDTAFVLKDRALHLESVAAGEKKGEFYLSSIYKKKILKQNGKGEVSDFTKEAEMSSAAVLAVKVDPGKKVLWASASPIREVINYDSTGSSAVYQYNLSGQLMNVFTPASDKKSFVFGDLLLSKTGEVFVSDSENNIIFKVNPLSGRLEEFFSAPDFWNIQGITFSANEQYLYVADYIKGVFRLNMSSKTLSTVTPGPVISLKGIDGLIWYDNSLIAIQNGVVPMRVTRLYLNKEGNSIVSFKIIDRAHPAFNEPTNGCIVGDELYYVANSQWSAYNEQRELKPADQLQDIVILKNDLKKVKQD